jgi:hypothetical protein
MTLLLIVLGACVAAIGFAALFLAEFFGGHDLFGVEVYAVGAILTTATYAVVGLMGSAAVPRPIRWIATVLAVGVGLFWLAVLPSFLRSTGWNF